MGTTFSSEILFLGLYQTKCRSCHLCCLWRVRKSRSLRKGDTNWGSLGWMRSSLMPGTGSEPSLRLWQPWQRSESHAQSQTPPSSAWQREREAANRLPSFNRGAQGSGAGTLKDQWVQSANFMPKDLAGSALSSLKSSLDHVTFSCPCSWQPRKNTDNRGSHTQRHKYVHTYIHKHAADQPFKLPLQ